MPNLELPFLWSPAVPNDGDVPIWNKARNQYEPGPQTGGGGSATPVRISTSRTVLATETMVYANTTSAALTLTLPAAPTDGETHTFVDDHLTWNTNNLTIAANTGQTIASLSLPPSSGSYFGATAVATVQGGSVTVRYDLTQTRWMQV